MKTIQLTFAAGIPLAVVVVIFVWFENAVSNPNLTEFVPQETGRLESGMWRSYYEGRWLQLACQTIQGACGQYGFSWWDGARLSLHAARSALFFRKSTDDPRCLPELEQYYEIVRKATGRNFDSHLAAALELEWWKARRQGKAPIDYAPTIARLTGHVYGLPEGRVLRAAKLRAEAMAYRDARRDGRMTEADWQEIACQLQLAALSLKESVANHR